MGLAWQGKSIKNGDNIAALGERPSGLATQGKVVYRRGAAPALANFFVSWDGPLNPRTDLFFVGASFRPTQGVRVMSLGAFKLPGANNPRQIGLALPGGAVLATGWVDMGAVPNNTFGYLAIDPVTLEANVLYGIQMHAADYTPWLDLVSFTWHSAFTNVSLIYGYSGFNEFLGNLAGTQFGGIDFTFELA